MKTVTLILLVATLGFAEDQAKPAKQTRSAPLANKQDLRPGYGTHSANTARPSPAATSQNAAPAIPTGAVQVEPFLYRYTDAQGKTWMYRKTPFGVSKWEDKPAPEPVAEADPVTATDLGDSVRFERKTPFGTTHWVRKKTELTADEQARLAASKDHGAATAAAQDFARRRQGETLVRTASLCLDGRPYVRAGRQRDGPASAPARRSDPQSQPQQQQPPPASRLDNPPARTRRSRRPRRPVPRPCSAASRSTTPL